MKLQRTINTPEGAMTLSFDRCSLAPAAGFRDVNLDGVKIGNAHKVYDGWAATVHYDDRMIDFTEIGRNLAKTVERAAKQLQRKIDSQAKTMDEALARIEACDRMHRAAETRFDATGTLDDKFAMLTAREALREAKQVSVFIGA